MLFAVIIPLLLVFFAYVDVWYFVRLAILLIPHFFKEKFLHRGLKKISRDELLQTTSIEGVVLPFDLDLHCHMNNSKYLREMDFGRIPHYCYTGFYSSLKAVGGVIVVAATAIRYRKSLQLWQRFSVQTRIVCWRGDFLYTEQRFVDKAGVVCAIALLQMCVKKAPLERVLEKLCTDSPQSPAFPPEVASWEETIARSKEKMKKEREGN